MTELFYFLTLTFITYGFLYLYCRIFGLPREIVLGAWAIYLLSFLMIALGVE